MRKIALLFVALITSMTLMAQTTLKGKVLDANLGEPIIGATIMVKGTSVGCVADFDGNFTTKHQLNSTTKHSVSCTVLMARKSAKHSGNGKIKSLCLSIFMSYL